MQFPRRCTVLCMLVPVVLDFNVVFCRYYYYFFLLPCDGE